jgi:hypothetical protein
MTESVDAKDSDGATIPRIYNTETLPTYTYYINENYEVSTALSPTFTVT